MGRVSSGANSDVQKVWIYNATSTGSNEAIATVVASGYFDDFMINLTLGLGPLSIGDVIVINGNDASGMYIFTAVTTAVTVSTFAAIGTIGTSNIDNLAVTTAKLAADAVTNAKLADDAVETANILDANVTSAKVDPLLIQHAQVDVDLATFIGSYTASALLVAAPGANKKLIVHRVVLWIDYGGTVLANGGAMHVQYDSTANGAGTKATGTLAAATLIAATADTTFGFTPVDTTLVDSTTLNKGLYLAAATADFTGGTSSAYKVDVWYSVLDVA